MSSKTLYLLFIFNIIFYDRHNIIIKYSNIINGILDKLMQVIGTLINFINITKSVCEVNKRSKINIFYFRSLFSFL